MGSGYTMGCSPTPELPASLGTEFSSWKDRTGSEQQDARGCEDPLRGPGWSPTPVLPSQAQSALGPNFGPLLSR